MTHAPASTQSSSSVERVPPLLVATVVLLGAVGPLATDMYLPGFAQATRELRTTQGLIALTLTTFFTGMALGQLIGGPVSDRYGRRPPLLAGTVSLLLASIACAFAPTIGVLLVARFAQGLTAGVGMVVGRAVLVDVTRGTTLVRMMNLVMALSSIAPLVAPLLGAAVIRWASWRGAFWGVAVLAAVQLAGVVLAVPETLPPERRHGGGLATFGRNAAGLVRRRVFVAYVLVTGASTMALHSYIAQSPMVLQQVIGLSPTQYSLVFAVNSIGIVAASTTSTRLAGRVPARTVLVGGLVLECLGGLLLSSSLPAGTPLAMVWPSFLLLTTGVGFVAGNSGALASAEAADLAGTGSAVLGVVQYTAAALAPAVVNGLDQHAVWPVALMMVAMPLVGLASVATLTRRR